MGGRLMPLALCLALAGCADPAADKAALDNHCQMVELWEQTHGELGWPDYNNTAASCGNSDNGANRR